MGDSCWGGISNLSSFTGWGGTEEGIVGIGLMCQGLQCLGARDRVQDLKGVGFGVVGLGCWAWASGVRF